MKIFEIVSNRKPMFISLDKIQVISSIHHHVSTNGLGSSHWYFEVGFANRTITFEYMTDKFTLGGVESIWNNLIEDWRNA